MAMQGGSNGQGMSATPQGVEAQQAMVDITTNNYQKAIEGFFSHYCSYALTMYFQELKSVKTVAPTAESRVLLLRMGLPVESLKEDGTLDMDFEAMATEYFVRCVPGSLVEMEDEKQLRILNQLFIPLSQAMPALSQVQDPAMLQQAAAAMQYIISKEIQLSGSAHSKEIESLWSKGDQSGVQQKDARIEELELASSTLALEQDARAEAQESLLLQLQEQISLLSENQRLLLEKIGAAPQTSTSEQNSSVGV